MRHVDTLALLSVLVVAGLHATFMILEMLFWEKPAGRRVFGTTREQARQSAVLAKNQGLYNGFLAAGLLWGACDPVHNANLLIFLLGCVIAAGVFGALTAHRAILWVQALPGAIALALVLYAGW